MNDTTSPLTETINGLVRTTSYLTESSGNLKMNEIASLLNEMIGDLIKATEYLANSSVNSDALLETHSRMMDVLKSITDRLDESVSETDKDMVQCFRRLTNIENEIENLKNE